MKPDVFASGCVVFFSHGLPGYVVFQDGWALMGFMQDVWYIATVTLLCRSNLWCFHVRAPILQVVSREVDVLKAQ